MIKQKQNGSALVVVSMVIVVILLAALGYILWKNLNPTKDDSPAQTTTENRTDTSVKLLTGKTDERFPIQLSWSYPETWTVKSANSDPNLSADTSTSTVTSPSQNYEVTYRVGWNSGIGGTCEPGADTLKYINHTPVTGFEKALFTEVISGSESNGYSLMSGLFSNSDNVNAYQEGDSTCDLIYGQIIDLGAAFNEEKGTLVLWSAQIHNKNIKSFNDTGAANPTSKDTETIKKSFEDSEYIEAKKILLSTVSN